MLLLAVVLLLLSNTHIRQALAARDQALSDLEAQEQETRAAERDKTLQLAEARWNEAGRPGRSALAVEGGPVPLARFWPR
jgi:hypothetical protein